MQLDGSEMPFMLASHTHPAVCGCGTASVKGKGREEGSLVGFSVQVVHFLAGCIVQRGRAGGDVVSELPVRNGNLDRVEAFVGVGEVVCFRVTTLQRILIRLGETLSYGLERIHTAQDWGRWPCCAVVVAAMSKMSRMSW